MKALTFLAKNQKLFNATPMGKQQTPHLSNHFYSACSVINKPKPNNQWPATTMTTGLKVGKTGASLAPHSRVRVDGAIVPKTS